jgi:hypothetical protein
MTALIASFSAVIGGGADWLDADQMVGRQHGPVQAGGDGIGGGRDDRQPVGPAVAVVQLLDGGDVVGVVEF